MHERFFRWVLEIESKTLGYMIREEFKREKMRSRLERRVWNFEKRAKEGSGGELVRQCMREMRERIEEK